MSRFEDRMALGKSFVDAMGVITMLRLLFVTQLVLQP